MRGGGRLQVHGYCSRRLMYSETVETRSDYKKSYLRGFKYPACDWTGRNRTEKDQVRVLAGFFFFFGGGGGDGEKGCYDFVYVEHL